MTGYFSLGEFGAVKGGKATFHGTTCSWVALKEK
jgi:small ligand-binding sensory domain FIST